MTYAAFRTSPKRYTRRPPAANQAARLAWDCLTENGSREIVSMGLLDGLWICELPDGSLGDVEADWIASLTPKSRQKLAMAINRRAAQGRA